MNLTKLSEHDNVTKNALDNDVQKEEIAKDIMKKVREILAAAQEDDVTEKPKKHIDIFMDLIDNKLGWAEPHSRFPLSFPQILP